MPQGVVEEFWAMSASLDQVLEFFSLVLDDMKFQITKRIWDGTVVRLQAIWGKKSTSILVTMLVPYGSWIKEGNRYGIEMEMMQDGSNVAVNLLVVPLMEAVDDVDMMFFTQGYIERMTDDRYCQEIKSEFLQRLAFGGLVIAPKWVPI
jgi:hypothetical protein